MLPASIGSLSHRRDVALVGDRRCKRLLIRPRMDYLWGNRPLHLKGTSIIKKMAATTPLKGLELVDCARANAKQGMETAANLCGYGADLNTFKQELQQACQAMGVEFHELTDLITDQQRLLTLGEGEIVAPDSTSQL